MNYNSFLPNPFLINSEHSWKSFSQLIINKTGDPYSEEQRKHKPSRIQKKRKYTMGVYRSAKRSEISVQSQMEQ